MSAVKKYYVTIGLRYDGGQPISGLVIPDSKRIAEVSVLALADSREHAVALAMDTVRAMVPDQDAFRVDSATVKENQ